MGWDPRTVYPDVAALFADRSGRRAPRRGYSYSCIEEDRDHGTPCWIWQGPTYGNGYAAVSFDGRPKLGHRYVYERLVGPIPEGLVIDHLCRVRECVNPAHLEPVTDRENILRGVGMSAKWAVATHCLRGHELNDDTVSIVQGARRCKLCDRIRSKRHRDRKRAGLV